MQNSPWTAEPLGASRHVRGGVWEYTVLIPSLLLNTIATIASVHMRVTFLKLA